MLLLDYADSYARRYRPYKGGAWCYEDGCLYRGLVLLHKATGQTNWIDHLLRLTAPQIAADGALLGYDPDEFNIDNILAGRCLFHLSRLTSDPRYESAMERLADQLDRHPRTLTGNYWHKKIYPGQVWLDGLYMALPFQIELGLWQSDERRIDDAIRQFASALDLTRRPDGLFAHGCDTLRQQDWADPITGQNPALWSRALGWLAMALADAADLLATRADGDAIRRELTALLTRLAQLTTPEGLLLQVPDAPGLTGNYVETSASAMFAYANLVAGRLGLFPQGRTIGQRALAALQTLALKRGPAGVELNGICHVAGLGGTGQRRDGTAAYYLSEPVVSDDPKGAGPLMTACAETLAHAVTERALS